MRSPSLTAQRLITVVAATLVALACGTNYAYSAWAPQFRERMKFSSTEINLIGTAANLGTHASGIPLGLMVDAKGPRPGTLVATIALFVGYFPIHRAYAAGPGSISMPFLLFFSFMSGFGSCSGFSAAIKTAASNFPSHRGSATAFPLAAFGLSAFFFSTLSAMAFKDNTSHFLLLLAVGTAVITFTSTFFLRLLPYSGTYSSIPGERTARPSQLRRTKSVQSAYQSDVESGTQQDLSNSPLNTQEASSSYSATTGHTEQHVPSTATQETSSLMTRSRTSSLSADSLDENDEKMHHNSLYADVRGFALLAKVEFWQQFLILGILTGIGLMTINNMGNDVRALWRYYDDSVDNSFLQGRQAMHVSALSMLSFCGRLISGIGSDFLVKDLRMSRLWCIFASTVFFCISQFTATQVSNPHHLIFVSCTTGLAYGMLFGVFPSIVSHTFGIDGLSQNWGVMTLAAVLGGYVFNNLYGTIYDHNSLVTEDGERDCREGLKCYAAAYHVTFYAGVAAAAITLWSIWHEKRVMSKRQAEKEMNDRLA